MRRSGKRRQLTQRWRICTDRQKRRSPSLTCTGIPADKQVKVRGYRIELQEIEAVLRGVCGTEQVVAVGWPVRNGLAEGIIAFVSRNEALDENVVLAECRESLPEYMIPRRIYLRSEFPLNANGKIDRQALIQQLDAEEGQPQETAVLRGSVR